MFRPTVARSALRALPTSNASVARSALHNTLFRAQLTTSTRHQSIKNAKILALTARKPASTALTRYLSTSARLNDEKNEVLIRSSQKLQPLVQAVPVEAAEEEPDVDMAAGIRAEFKTIVDTFEMKEVPKEALYVGLAGVIPYLATSLSTVVLAWDINQAHLTGVSPFFSGSYTAESLLHLIEPIQVGYGAVILSFLGAIHWGLEWAGYGGHQGYKRYAFGVVAPALAWPTLLMPIEYALITQFITFTFLYYNDAKSVVRGWSPPWYATYRFVLTFIVGASIVLSLIGRGQIADMIDVASGPADKFRAAKAQQVEELEIEEAKRRQGSSQEGDDE